MKEATHHIRGISCVDWSDVPVTVTGGLQITAGNPGQRRTCRSLTFQLNFQSFSINACSQSSIANLLYYTILQYTTLFNLHAKGAWKFLEAHRSKKFPRKQTTRRCTTIGMVTMTRETERLIVAVKVNRRRKTNPKQNEALKMHQCINISVYQRVL